MSTAKTATRRNVWKLLGVVVGMFGFGFALVPMYNALCQLTNLNGKDTGLLAAADVVEQPDETRTVNVQFLTTVNGGRLYSFKPEQSSIDVHPGKLYTVYFVATNQQDIDSVGQAVPSVVPWNAARHLHKTECFCFNQQPFKANEEKRMPVRFMLDPAIPADVQTMTLSYTFFDVTQLARDAGKTIPSAPKS
jgi:cytochrome c oxidase assembly protein subunit 11